MITIYNSKISVEISEKGAELQSIKVDGAEYLWNGDPKFWTNRAPVLFPICGGLKEDKFCYQNKEYTLTKHGFAKLMDFSVETAESTRAVFLLKSNAETLKKYPFSFEFRVIFELEGNSLKITYKTDNKTNGEMYCSCGCHEAFFCPEGIEEYDVIFPQKETISAYGLDGNLLKSSSVPVLNNETTIHLNYNYFAVDALVFKDVKSRTVKLKNRKTGRTVTENFEGFDYFLIWTKPGANYICLEPWSGIPDEVGSSYNIEEKTGINKIEKGGTLVKTHIISF